MDTTKNGLTGLLTVQGVVPKRIRKKKRKERKTFYCICSDNLS